MKPFFPWRFVSPRRAYFREIKVARACPEIKHLIDKAAFYKLCERATMIVPAIIFAIVIPLAYLVDIGRRLLQKIAPVFPDFSNRRRAVIDEIYKKIPQDEIRRRAGLEPAPKVVIKRNNVVVDGSDVGVLTHVEEVQR